MEKEKFPGKTSDDLQGHVQAAYEVVIDVLPEGAKERPADWKVLVLLEELRSEVSDELTKRAVLRFGPAYRVEVTEGRTGGSVHATVLLAVRYPVRCVTGAVDELRRFAGEIEVVIAEALERKASMSFQVAAEADEQSLPAPEAGTEETSGWDRIAPILAAIGTGIGVLGFVTFIGGAIDWARFHAAGLPQEQALAVVPTQDLVVIGARTLVPAVTWGLVACVIYVLTTKLLGTREQRIKSPKLGLAEAHGPIIRALFLAVVVAWVELISLPDLSSLTTKSAVYLVLVGLTLPLLTFAVAKRTDRFLYLAPTVFLALSIFAGAAAYVRALDIPELRPAAVVRNNQEALVGFFVAENHDRVYFARLDLGALKEDRIDRSSSRLIGIDKEEIGSVVVGTPINPEAALEQARQLADELCELEVPAIPKKRPSREIQYCWSNLPGREGKLPPP